MAYKESLKHRMVSHYGTYCKEKTVITLTFNKRETDSNDSLLDIIDYTLRPMSEWMRDLEIDIK
jgi:hypothetical protein